MNVFGGAVIHTGEIAFARSFQRQVSSITTTAIAEIDCTGCTGSASAGPGRLLLTTCETANGSQASDAQTGPTQDSRSKGTLQALLRSGSLCHCTQLHDPQENPNSWPDWLDPAALRADASGHRSGRWVVFSCRFADGSEDRIALHLEGSQHDAHCIEILPAIWPLAREDALRERLTRAPEPKTARDTSEAMLWTISTKSDSAVLVLDGAGRLLDCNEAGCDMLAAGNLLRNSDGVLRCANSSETRAFYAAVQDCAKTPVAASAGAHTPRGSASQELILFLQDASTGMRLPVSLTCYLCADTRHPLVVAILPRQPDQQRIEMLAQKMGLSPCEARVAALIQLGLSNREAAHIAGIKEQTFNTYAKRVLSKLEVAGRTEMAQRLTWQASLGRAS
ncbi:putative regulatory protein, LuxR family (plasmid) [Phaeobacter piscinae]|uniref:Regulatory protein, LuxR family n=2 Tax=Phaeobacter TaxID=302485 RepID=A0AAN1GVS8_9RHOB|nr:LuxR C-terminal-related transcriptional regulator [Phaeobacter piscinae]ATG46001.1 putative regulatory protein, LuxR family [Phaeobacter piscinae]AUR38324.1 putative regulatory protein, LuxR family [Phaeobacter piscinae]